MATQSTKATAGRQPDPGWAWSVYQADAERPWNLALAGHLFRRAGFGATWDQLEQAKADGPKRSIDRLLRPETDVAAFNRRLDEIEVSLAQSQSAESLQAWWLRRMIQTPQPLLEKMTLFWHGHFATSNTKVQRSDLMIKYVQQLRAHALGSYAELLAAVAHDPAVFVGLGADEQRKARPSESYARQVMVWSGVGPEEMSQRDIHEVARAFTGWFVLRGEIRFVEREHDTGVKKILGREGPFTGKDVVQIALTQQSVPRMVVRKLYRWLISETDEPSDALLAPLVEPFAESYDVGKLVETMLRSNLFFSPAAYRQKIKSPVEFALGIVRPLESLVPTVQMGNHLAMLGQELGNPPTALGWEGGRYWINEATLLGRDSLAVSLLSGSGPYGNALDPAAVARKHGCNDAASARQFLLKLFLQDDLAPDVRTALLRTAAESDGDLSQQLRRFAHAIVVQPEFQLT